MQTSCTVSYTEGCMLDTSMYGDTNTHNLEIGGQFILHSVHCKIEHDSMVTKTRVHELLTKRTA